MTGKLFGTTGIRKIYGKEFDIEMALDLGKALGTYLKDGTVLLAHDARMTGKMIADAMAAGIMSTGVNVEYAGLLPTPTLAFATRLHEFDTGVMITASHNPPEYTGIKFWRGDSRGYAPEEERRLEEIYTSRQFQVAEWNSLGRRGIIETAVDEHIEQLLGHCDSEAIAQRQFKVVVDPGNGASCVLTPYLIQRLGCKVISINSQPDGHFPGRKSEPDESSLGDLANLVKTAGADLGIAHDGDADRVVFVTEEGEVIRSDRTIALLAKTMLKESKNKTIVTTVDSSLALDETVTEAGGKIIRTPVGDIQVAIKMEETNAIFGGEACGVFIFPELHMAPEPFLAACKILELMALTGRSFGDLISEIPVYPLKKTKIPCPNERKSEVMRQLAELFPQQMPDLVDLLTVDGLGMTLKEGWVLVRPSGTEPVIRITCEGPRAEIVDDILDRAKRVVEEAVS
ncbi:MAG: phosphoglucosamine mutase [Candidatus Thorarchaeota archaeon]|nr:phosphoglucosamine mutase [Candidatus Thorarchaeota archaeon]